MAIVRAARRVWTHPAAKGEGGELPIMRFRSGSRGKTHLALARDRAAVPSRHAAKAARPSVVVDVSFSRFYPLQNTMHASAACPSRVHVSVRARGRVVARGASRAVVVRAAAVDVASKLSAEDVASWESCKSLVMDLGLDEENAERSLVKAFGWGPQNYWRKSKVEEVPSVDDVEARLDYLVEIGVPREKIVDIVFKVPEVIGCELELIQDNVAHIEKAYFMKRKTKNFANYILRVPQVLGNNLDCVGDCAGECNRCWARC